MGYQSQIIANFGTGVDRSRQAWLIPDDAQTELNDGFVYRGVIEKRNGYDYYATGNKSDLSYCESRIVHKYTDEIYGSGDGTEGPYLHTAAHLPVRRGDVTVVADGSQTVTDDGEGAFSGDGTGTIDYTTGEMEITFTSTVAAAADNILVTYNAIPDEPVMMVANFYTANDTVELIVADTKYVNKYNSTTNRLDDITTRVYTGDKFDFFSWVNYPDPNDDKRLLFVNNVDVIQQYDGTTVSDFFAYYNTATVTNESYGTGDGTTGPYLHTLANVPVVPGSVTVTANAQVVTDDGNGAFTGDGTGTIDYDTGDASITFTSNVTNLDPITVDYQYYDNYVDTCLLMFNFKDRLLLFRTTEGGTVYPQRIRISGTGANGDNFVTTSSGAGVIDIPDGSWIMGVTQNRDALLIWMERSTWILRYTGNDVVPFDLQRIDSTRGSGAPFSPITYLSVSNAYSRYGFVASDTYSVQRTDNKLPSYSFDSISQENFELCFSGEIIEDRDHYLIHPSAQASESDKILVTNYEEDTYQFYLIPLSCMGQYYESFDVIWNDLVAPEYPDWYTFGNKFGSWNNIGFSKDTPISIGGGHHGEIWRLNADGSDDNPTIIRDIAIVSTSPNVITITTDWNNYKIGDFIYLSGLSGMTEANQKQGFITSVTDNYTFTVEFDPSLPDFTAWTSGGIATRTIPFEMVTKQFNPYINQNERMRCGWVYIYASTAGTNLTEFDENGEEVPTPAKLDVEVYMDDHPSPATYFQLALPYESNMSETSKIIGSKKWYKLFINQTGNFIQLKLFNNQAGARVKIHSLMFGFSPAGRLI